MKKSRLLPEEHFLRKACWKRRGPFSNPANTQGPGRLKQCPESQKSYPSAAGALFAWLNKTQLLSGIVILPGAQRLIVVYSEPTVT